MVEAVQVPLIMEQVVVEEQELQVLVEQHQQVDQEEMVYQIQLQDHLSQEVVVVAEGSIQVLLLLQEDLAVVEAAEAMVVEKE
tara:strand:+ start:252 stop:500 length:249 start_codon:yes stop_codon:yes gene_type:complete